MSKAAPTAAKPSSQAAAAPTAAFAPEQREAAGAAALDITPSYAPPTDRVARRMFGDPRLSGSVRQRAALMRQIQRSVGNRRVDRGLEQVERQAVPVPASAVEPAVAAPSGIEAPHDAHVTSEPTARSAGIQRIFNPLEALGDLASSAGKALLNPIAGMARGLPGYSLLAMILGKDPISDKEVERSPSAIVRGLLEFVPRGNEIYANLNESGAIDKAFGWLGEQWSQLGLTWAAIKGLFSKAWDKLDKSDMFSPSAAWEKIKGVFAEPAGRLVRFGGAVADKVLEFVFEGVLSKLGGGQVLAIIHKVGDAFKQIIKDPIGFLSNLIKGVKLGLTNFVGHIGVHLQKGLTTWLFGELGSTNLKLPEKFDLKGVFGLAAQVLGLTPAAIRARAIKQFGPKTVEQLEGGAQKGFKLFTIIRDQGLGGIWEAIKEQLGNLKELAFGALKELVASQIVQAGIQLVVKLLGGPAGAIIQAIQSVYGVVTWFINNASRLASLVSTITDSVQAISQGALDQAAKFIESSFADVLPIALGFLANLAGFGGIGQKIKGVIEKIQDPVHQAVDWVLDKAKGFAKRLKLDKAVGKIKAGAGRLANGVRGAIGKIKAGAGRLANGVRGAIGKIKGAFGKGGEHDTKEALQSAKVKQDVLAEVQSRSGRKFTNIAEFSAMISSIYNKYSSRGLKTLTAKGGQKTGKVHIEAIASPAEGVDLSSEVVKLSPDQYQAALEMTMPRDALDNTATLVEKIAQGAGKRAAETPDFIALCKAKKWTAAGTMFHSIAAKVAREMVDTSSKDIPAGYEVHAEYTVKNGKGGSRIDLFIVKPDGNLVGIDWKTTGRSALGYKKQQEKHQQQVLDKEKRPLVDQASRSWVTYVRPYLTRENIDWLRG